ncbi:MAG: hypothetical protein K9L77_01815 [Candidatus Omnitrophica bacterium]|nr:hypothetical protein [Candidatus Omnitrophota bacterium]
MKSFREKKKKSQSVVEYAVAFMVVAASLISVGFIANAKGIFQNHFSEASGKIKADSGSKMAVNTSAANLASLIQNKGYADFNQAAGMYGDNPDQVSEDFASVDSNTSIASVLGSGSSEGDMGGDLSAEEMYEITEAGYEQAQENVEQAETGVEAAENYKDQAYADWQKAEADYQYWDKEYEKYKELYEQYGNSPSDIGYKEMMDEAKAERDQAREIADELEEEYNQRVEDYELSLEALDTAVNMENQAYQDYLEAKEEYES